MQCKYIWDKESHTSFRFVRYAFWPRKPFEFDHKYTQAKTEAKIIKFVARQSQRIFSIYNQTTIYLVIAFNTWGRAYPLGLQN